MAEAPGWMTADPAKQIEQAMAEGDQKGPST